MNMNPPVNHYNPYALLTPELLHAMLRQPMFFVRQFYPRGKTNSEDTALPLLLTHYTHHEVDSERARRHMRLLYQDRLRRLYDSTVADDLKKLHTAAAQPEGYRIYINLLAQPWQVNQHWKKKIERYIRSHLPHWNLAGASILNVTLKDRMGSLYLGLSWKHHQTEVLLDEIETIHTCVTT
jgi:hypothetical protein